MLLLELILKVKAQIKKKAYLWETIQKIVVGINPKSDEIGKKISKSNNNELGDISLKLVKRQIYPFWLMYLGYNEKEDLLNKMIEDRVGYDLDKYPIDKSLHKLDILEFIIYCIKNSRNILKINNITQIEQIEEIEII